MGEFEIGNASPVLINSPINSKIKIKVEIVTRVMINVGFLIGTKHFHKYYYSNISIEHNSELI